jgi:hypothetical protein
MRRRLTAVCALAAFVLALLLPSVAATHVWADADLSGAEAGLFGHPTTQIESPRLPVGPEHCALCHWLQGLGRSMTSGLATGPALVELTQCRSTSTLSLAAVYRGGCPARAPPLLLAL